MSDGSMTRAARNRKFCEGWLEHKAHKPTGVRYEKIFALLEENVIYIFSTNKPSQETQIGNLTLDSDTKFIVRGGNASKGFKFHLNAGKRLNTFKTKKSTERELWRGYIVGIATGFVPHDLDLLDSEVTTIQRDVAAYHSGDICDYDPKRNSISSSRSVPSKIESGFESLEGRSLHSDSSSSEETRSRRSASVVSSVTGTLNPGGPTMVHKFYNDHNREQEPPSWFIPHCSREMAEKVLQTAVDTNNGNTLMRESTSHLSNGSYVISKLSVDSSDGSMEFEHFEVIRTARGYKVNVQNPHEPMKCLSDVMDYFMRTSGGSTRPLRVNDPKVLGQETPGYSTHIHARASEPWIWPPRGSREEPIPDGPPQYYDGPSSPPHRHNSINNIVGSQTVSQGTSILRNRPLPSPNSQRKSVGWSSVITTPPPERFQTFAGTRSRQEPVPSMAELAQRSKEADQIEEFDTMLSGFERSTIYVNDPASQREVTPCQPPPPPAAHVPERPRSYINMNANSEQIDPDLEALPVAPPAPRVPIVTSPTAASNTRNSVSNASSVGLKSSTSSPAMSVKHRNSSSSSSNMSNTAQTRSNLTKSISENQLKNVRSPESPKNFPTWNTPKQNSVLNQTNKQEVVRGDSGKHEEVAAGVDDKTPGGVSALRSRFETGSNASPVSSKPVGSSHSLKNMTNPTRTQEVMHDRQRHPNDDEDGLYDDTGVPHAHETDTDRGRLNPEFKKKLEGMFGEANASPSAGRGPRPGSLHTSIRPSSAGAEDHIYQELPEVIPPDGVFYANERYNVDQNNT